VVGRGEMPLQTYKGLKVWQKAIDLVEPVYVLTKNFPNDEKFGLVSQMRRAAVSVPANIAEGYGRTHRGDYLRHLSFSRGSLLELETHLVIAGRLGFVGSENEIDLAQRVQEVDRMLYGLIESLSE
jgi:four helix bundle protein